ncbi:hypothetical protein EV121DRAFT_204243 [Schizophyllum commune]
MSRVPSEILHIIFTDEAITQSDLAQLARVQREWYDAAILLLWQTMHGLRGLLLLMPDDALLLEHIPRTGTDDLVSRLVSNLRRQINEDDLTPVLRRSHFVKTLIVDRDPALECHEAVIDALAQCLPPQCLFPNLLSLRLDFKYADYSSLSTTFNKYLNLLLSHHMTSAALEELTVTNRTLPCANDYLTYAPVLFTAVQQRYSNLEKIEFSIRERPPGTLLAIFARLPNLRSLDLYFNHRNRNSKLTSATASTLPNGFPSLTHLSVHYLNAPSLAGAVRSWRFPRLQSFAAHQIMRASVDQVCDLLLALRERVSHGTLRSLHIRGTRHSGTGVPLRLHHILALAAFPHLTHVTLDATLGVLLADDEHAQVAGWWPQLEFLAFNTNFIIETSSSQENAPATLSALIYYARSCLKLRELEIPLVIHSVPEIPDDLVSRPFQHPLERLFLGYSALDQTCEEGAAAFWCVLFPKCGVRSKA